MVRVERQAGSLSYFALSRRRSESAVMVYRMTELSIDGPKSNVACFQPVFIHSIEDSLFPPRNCV
jgi:hypothetical protein